MVVALAQANKTLVMPEGLWIMIMTREAFDNILLKEASCNYDDYRLVNRQVLGLGMEGMPEEAELAHHKCLESRLE